MAFGQWQNQGGDNASGDLSMAKPADLPTGESTTPVGWSAQWPTVQQWRQTLQGDASKPFDGRQVKEAAGPTHADSCHYKAHQCRSLG